MIANSRKILFIKIITGCAVSCMSPFLSAATWPAVPYGLLSIGGRSRLDWNADWRNKLSFEGGSCLGGLGLFKSASYLDDWSYAGELLYHRQWSGSEAVEQGIFLAPKLIFPRSAGVEFFVGGGPGKLWPISTLKKGESNGSIDGIAYLGGSWHLNNGYYWTMRGTYFLHSAKHKKHSFSLSGGLQCELI